MKKKLKKIGKYVSYIILLVFGILMFVEACAKVNFFEKLIGYDFDIFDYLIAFIIVVILLLICGGGGGGNSLRQHDEFVSAWKSQYGL